MKNLLVSAAFAAALVTTAPALAQTTTETPTPTPEPPLPKYTICHRTNSVDNPYVIITVRQVAVDGVAGNSGSRPDHYGEHQGPIFDPANPPPPPHDGDQWGDIIPPVPGFHDGLNWTEEGQELLRNGCDFPPPSPSPTTPPPTSPPPTSPPPTSPPPTSPPPTSPPPTSPPPTPSPSLTPGTIEAVCVGNIPYLAYAVDISDLPPDSTVDITFLNPHGADVTFADQPLSGQVLWPGADPGPPPQWPGWTQLPDGSYVERDNFGWTRPTVRVLFEVNPSFTRLIHYPPASSTCANPPGGPGNHTAPPPPPTALTGADLRTPAAVAGALLLLGLVASFIARRRSLD